MFFAPLELVSGMASYTKWAFQHKDLLFTAPGEVGRFVQSVIEHGGNAIRRIGSTIVFGGPDQSQHVLGFIDQASRQLDHIETALQGANANQALLSASVASLQKLSMITLGLSALTPALLVAQFRWLSKQHETLRRDLRNLAKLVAQGPISELQGGLGVLEDGVAKADLGLIEKALVPCRTSVHYFSDLVGNAIRNSDDRKVILHLARHLSIAICGTARCHIALQYDDRAKTVIETHKKALTESARYVFQLTVAQKPERFLIPKLSKVVSLEFLQSLFRQAGEAEIIPDSVKKSIPDVSSVAAFFEGVRPNLFHKSKWPFGPDTNGLQDEIRDAAASVEETNRVLSLQTFLEQAERAKTTAFDAVRKVDKERAKIESGYFAWSFASPAPA